MVRFLRFFANRGILGHPAIPKVENSDPPRYQPAKSRSAMVAKRAGRKSVVCQLPISPQGSRTSGGAGRPPGPPGARGVRSTPQEELPVEVRREKPGTSRLCSQCGWICLSPTTQQNRDKGQISLACGLAGFAKPQRFPVQKRRASDEVVSGVAARGWKTLRRPSQWNCQHHRVRGAEFAQMWTGDPPSANNWPSDALSSARLS